MACTLLVILSFRPSLILEEQSLFGPVSKRLEFVCGWNLRLFSGAAENICLYQWVHF